MKAIILTESTNSVEYVFASRTIQDLIFEAGLFPQFFSKADLLGDPNYFADVEYVFSTWGMPRLEEDEIARCLPRLKAVFYAAGTVQSFARPFLAKGVRIFSAWQANAVPVAEYAVSQILLANKGFFQASRRLQSKATRAAAYDYAFGFPGNFGCSVGILGAGQIGRRVIKALKENFRLDVKVFDPFYPEEAAQAAGVGKCSLDEVFETCQTISNHMANNDQTKGMLTYRQFSLMKDNATFINTGRGAQVVEDDLVRALREKPGRTAVLDVTMPEPPEEGHPFYTMPNVFLTPHIAGSSGQEVHRMSELMLAEFRRFRAGEKSDCEVTPAMLATMA